MSSKYIKSAKYIKITKYIQVFKYIKIAKYFETIKEMRFGYYSKKYIPLKLYEIDKFAVSAEKLIAISNLGLQPQLLFQF